MSYVIDLSCTNSRGSFRVAQSLVFCVVLCLLLFVLLTFSFFFFLSLYCLPFFDLRLLIIAVVSSNFSFEELYTTEDVKWDVLEETTFYIYKLSRDAVIDSMSSTFMIKASVCSTWIQPRS